MTEKVKRKFYPPPQSFYFPEIPGLTEPIEYKGIFSNQSKDHNNLRTNSLEGHFTKPPAVGKPFSIAGQSLTEGGSMRLVSTSPVTEILMDTGGSVIFKTENSEYRLDYYALGDDNDLE